MDSNDMYSIKILDNNKFYHEQSNEETSIDEDFKMKENSPSRVDSDLSNMVITKNHLENVIKIYHELSDGETFIDEDFKMRENSPSKIDSNLSNMVITKNHLENIINLIGYNKYTILVIIFNSLINFLWGAEQQYVSLSLYKYAKINKIEENIFSILLSIIYLDMYVGVIVVQLLTNSFPRNYRLTGALIVYITCSLTCSFVNNFYTVYILRLIGDFFCGTTSIGFDLLYEYTPHKSKYKILIQMISSGFYSFGIFYNVILFYTFENDSDDIYGHKLSNALFCTPIFITLVLSFFINDSPFYLIILNKRNEAFDLIQRMGKSVIDDFTLSEIDENKIIMQFDVANRSNSNMTTLFDRNNFSLTLKNIIINTLLCGISYGIYFLYNSSQNKFPQLIELTEKTQNYIFSIALFPNGLISGLLLSCKIFNGRYSLIYSSFINSILCVITGLFPNLLIAEIVTIYFINYVQLNVVQYYIADFYSTEIRDLAQTFILGISNILGSLSPMFIELIRQYSELSAYVVLGLSYIIISVISTSLPNSKIPSN